MIIFFRKEHIFLPVVILLIQSHSCYGFQTKNILSKNIISNIPRPPTQRTSQTFRILPAERTFRTHELYLTEDPDIKLSLLKSNNIDARTYVTVFGILPILSFLTFDQLLSQITDFNLAPADRQLWIIALLLSKRLYIYALALTTVDLAAKRSVDLPASLGQVTHSMRYRYISICMVCIVLSSARLCVCVYVFACECACACIVYLAVK